LGNVIGAKWVLYKMIGQGIRLSRLAKFKEMNLTFTYLINGDFCLFECQFLSQANQFICLKIILNFNSGYLKSSATIIKKDYRTLVLVYNASTDHRIQKRNQSAL
jgi:hypothetical protein